MENMTILEKAEDNTEVSFAEVHICYEERVMMILEKVQENKRTFLCRYKNIVIWDEIEMRNEKPKI